MLLVGLELLILHVIIFIIVIHLIIVKIFITAIKNRWRLVTSNEAKYRMRQNVLLQIKCELLS